jgi:hypothetical protein
MREYKPIRTAQGRILSRKKQMGRLILLQYLNWYELWSINKGSAKVFYNQHSVESAITVMRFKDKKKSEEDF